MYIYSDDRLPVIFIIGNKKDMTDVREVSTNMVENLTRELLIENLTYEVSAKSGEGKLENLLLVCTFTN
jgi:hypothetical protein